MSYLYQLHKVQNHQSEIAGCNKRKRKIYAHIIPKYANYGRIHIANFSHCALRHQVDIKAKKEKKMKEKKKEKIQAKNIGNAAEEEKRKLSSQLDIKIKIKESYTLNPESKEIEYEQEKNQDKISEERDYTKDF